MYQCPLWGLPIAWVACKAPPVLVRQATRGALRTPLCHRLIAALPTCHDCVALCSLVTSWGWIVTLCGRQDHHSPGRNGNLSRRSISFIFVHSRGKTGKCSGSRFRVFFFFFFPFFLLVQILSGSLATSQSFCALFEKHRTSKRVRQFGDPRRGPSQNNHVQITFYPQTRLSYLFFPQLTWPPKARPLLFTGRCRRLENYREGGRDPHERATERPIKPPTRSNPTPRGDQERRRSSNWEIVLPDKCLLMVPK